jgi:hypothetical protein
MEAAVNPLKPPMIYIMGISLIYHYKTGKFHDVVGIYFKKVMFHCFSVSMSIILPNICSVCNKYTLYCYYR